MDRHLHDRAHISEIDMLLRDATKHHAHVSQLNYLLDRRLEYMDEQSEPAMAAGNSD